MYQVLEALVVVSQQQCGNGGRQRLVSVLLRIWVALHSHPLLPNLGSHTARLQRVAAAFGVQAALSLLPGAIANSGAKAAHVKAAVGLEASGVSPSCRAGVFGGKENDDTTAATPATAAPGAIASLCSLPSGTTIADSVGLSTTKSTSATATTTAVTAVVCGRLTLLDLGGELLGTVLTFLSNPDDIRAAGSTCRILRHLCRSSWLWRHCFVSVFDEEIVHTLLSRRVLRDTSPQAFDDALRRFNGHEHGHIFPNILTMCQSCRTLFWSGAGHHRFDRDCHGVETITPVRLLKLVMM
jgi:hypothetical protein